MRSRSVKEHLDFQVDLQNRIARLLQIYIEANLILCSRAALLYLWLKIPPAKSFKFCLDPIFAFEEILVRRKEEAMRKEWWPTRSDINSHRYKYHWRQCKSNDADGLQSPDIRSDRIRSDRCRRWGTSSCVGETPFYSCVFWHPGDHSQSRGVCFLHGMESMNVH